jgi:hypothetical protein
MWSPLVHGPGRVTVWPQEDTSLSIWANGWVAHALAHAGSPLFSSSLFYPFGLNLLANTDSFGLALLSAPLTWLWGPIASMNFQLWLAPVVSALAMTLAVRPLVSRDGPALVAGALWGFSPFVLNATENGWTNLSWLLLAPVLLGPSKHSSLNEGVLDSLGWLWEPRSRSRSPSGWKFSR